MFWHVLSALQLDVFLTCSVLCFGCTHKQVYRRILCQKLSVYTLNFAFTYVNRKGQLTFYGFSCLCFLRACRTLHGNSRSCMHVGCCSLSPNTRWSLNKSNLSDVMNAKVHKGESYQRISSHLGHPTRELSSLVPTRRCGREIWLVQVRTRSGLQLFCLPADWGTSARECRGQPLSLHKRERSKSTHFNPGYVASFSPACHAMQNPQDLLGWEWFR